MDTRPPLSPEDAHALLDWYAAMGVDAAIEEEGQDRFAEVAARRAAAAPPPAPEPALRRPGPPAEALDGPERTAAAARAAASGAETLDELRAILERFDGCALKATASRTVFSDGTPGARLMLVGEAPGRDEDLSGLPFVGRSGQLLDRMLAAIGIDRASAYIANVIPWRPPGNRTPTPQELETCLPFIRRQIALADPDVLVTLGGPAAQSLFQTKEGILRLRGRWLDYDTGRRRIRALATLHPAYLLRQPGQKAFAWRDFKAVRRALDGG
ncbi:uracil-DNA glycosylase [Methylopila jiangsuensis]|uniref:Type-4 uracil-DNA glycosylase n=1 Tax=Methylopila jiangsuensis TaxID=586230 RepID=A0A9W6JFU2_9HYPH|nr:uracil-DNA glycosylase [Methylopila jiangsuensis]MDR6286838.1 DNA polymerase [Methylopila jiangsuensis]GLK76815.1 uracil-DNA glycosylase [Methylopila jiangsuensis]